MVKRREFLVGGAGGMLVASDYLSANSIANPTEPDVCNAGPANGLDGPTLRQDGVSSVGRVFNGVYRGDYLNQIAFPVGGIGAGMFCIDGNGAPSKFSFRHRPELERERLVFAAIAIRGRPDLARVLEGPLPIWKLRPQFPEQDQNGHWGLPRFREASFDARFPFATVELKDRDVPIAVAITAWSPFSPGDADNASLPLAALEYRLLNTSSATVEAAFSFNSENFLAEPSSDPAEGDTEPRDRIRATAGGFVLYGPGSRERPWDEGSCAIWADDAEVKVNHAWPLDSLQLLWQEFALGTYRTPGPQDRSAAGASLFLPISLAAGEAKVIRVHVAWYVPGSNLYEPAHGFRGGKQIPYQPPADRYVPWYAGRYTSIEDIARYWHEHYSSLRQAADLFSRTFYDSTLPQVVIEAVAANLSILKSPTVLRQTDGRLWGWEGCMMESDYDGTGVSGSTTHVWNYAQAIPHLFPGLERTLRETEFGSNQNDAGLQYSRTPLPIRPVEQGHTAPDGPAADGQLGAIIRVYREWRISGDSAWLRKLWPRVRSSLDYCIRVWDPTHRGWIEEPHLTTYDAKFWGADSFCASLYLSALQAVTFMGQALGDSVDTYSNLLHRGVERMETQLFNGEYFFQHTQWRGLRAHFPPKDDLDTANFESFLEWPALRDKEGPPAQYGDGCLADGVMGIWLGWTCGMSSPLDPLKVSSHLHAVHRHNFKTDLTAHTNFGRTSFACGNEGGLLLCTWPRGGRPLIPMVYSDEVWTGTEYQVASHLIAAGKVEAGLDIVRAVRGRYDGRIRNPFCEIEAGYWYARAMSSYALLQAFSGARFDAVEKVLYLKPATRGDFRCFISTATGYGTVGVKEGKPFIEVVAGEIQCRAIQYIPLN